MDGQFCLEIAIDFFLDAGVRAYALEASLTNRLNSDNLRRTRFNTSTFAA
jgi:hypothetical protein